MSHAPYSSAYGLDPSHDPWEKFRRRDEPRHRAEDELLFRINSIYSTTGSPSAPTTADIIHRFLSAGKHALDDSIPRQRQLLRDFLDAAYQASPPSSATLDSYVDDVARYSCPSDTALVCDRNIHPHCARLIHQPCNECYNFSDRMIMSDLCTHLNKRVSTEKHIDTCKRLRYVMSVEEGRGCHRRQEINVSGCDLYTNAVQI